MNTVFLQPPALTGDERSQLGQLYRYLFRLSEQLNASLEASDNQYAQVTKTHSGNDAAGQVLNTTLDQQYRELRSLIVKTADIVNQKMDKVVRQLSSDFQAISEEWGTFEQNIERTIVETAENTIEQFDFSEHIYGIDSETVDGVTQYSITSLGYIKRGIIGFDEENFPIYGIAVGTQLREKTVEKDGKEYSVIDNTLNIATYTSDRISFWVNGVERAYFTADKLYVTRVHVIDGITIGDWSIDVNDNSGLTVGQKIGNTIDISQNETMVKANRRIALMVDGASTDTHLVLTEQMLEVIAANVNLQANESIQLIVRPVQNAVDNLEVGATNLALERDLVLRSGDAPQYGALIWYTGTDCESFTNLEKGVEYTISFDVSADSTVTQVYAGEGMFVQDAVFEIIPGQRNAFRAVFKGSDATLLKAAEAGSIWLDRVKVERGNKATDWSPSPEEVRIGSGIDMDRYHIRLVSPDISIAIPAQDADDEEEIASFDENGLSAEVANIGKINSESVVPTQASTAFVPANGGELQAYLDNLSGHYIQGNVTIDASAVTGGVFTLDGLMGEGFLRIDGGVLNGLTVTRCTAPVYLYNNTFATAGTAVKALMSTLYLYHCDITAAVGVDISNGWTEATLDSCTGSCTKLAAVKYRSVLTVLGASVPYGLPECASGGEIYSELEFTEAPGSTEAPTVTELKLTASSKTWGGSWLSGSDLYQGRVGSGTLRRGCMWFDRTAIAGKTVKSAVLKLTRVAGIGGGGDVAVKIYGTTTASASGTPDIGTLFAQTNIAGGATKAVDVTAAVQALADGTISGLLIYDERTGTFSSKNYTYGYAKFSGAPVLEVTVEG